MMLWYLMIMWCDFVIAGCGSKHHHKDVIMGAMASQITRLTIVYSTVYSDADQRKHPISASLAFVRGIHRWLVNSPHKWPATRKMFPFDDVIMIFYKGSHIQSVTVQCLTNSICKYFQTHVSNMLKLINTLNLSVAHLTLNSMYIFLAYYIQDPFQ